LKRGIGDNLNRTAACSLLVGKVGLDMPTHQIFANMLSYYLKDFVVWIFFRGLFPLRLNVRQMA
jgi:hypothetical protein